ncbi:MAG: Aspartate 1-decarboxylase [Verrucomicrobia subdivision 3 bacterium]|nr:Aspartate 1-decarboxylase [Limisphaerales bacterium]MCS1413431.1 Aspartate 1-decarboxylase [Limisphaerales bacterium]
MEYDCLIEVLKSKLHRAEVTGANVDYEGSLSISEDLMEAVGIVPFEKILCGNQSNGARFETYAIPAPASGGQIILNGATARLGEVGDLLTILSFARMTLEVARGWKPSVATLSNGNREVSLHAPVAETPESYTAPMESAITG